MSNTRHGDSRDRAAGTSALCRTPESKAATPAAAALAGVASENSAAVDFVLGNNRAVAGMLKSSAFETFAADSGKLVASIAGSPALKTLAATATESIAALVRSPTMTSLVADADQTVRNLVANQGLAALVPRHQSVLDGLFENPGLKALIAGQNTTVTRLLGVAAQAFPASLMSTTPLSNLPGTLGGYAGARTAVEVLAANVAASNLRLLDAFTPDALSGLELGATARLARAFGENTQLVGWRETALGAHAAAALALSSPLRFDATSRSVLSMLTEASEATSRLAAHAAAVGPSGRTGPWASQDPSLCLGRYLHELPESAPVRTIKFGVGASQGVASLLTVDVLARDQRGVQAKAASKVFDERVAPAWLSGPAAARAEMMLALGALDEELPDLLEGAWEDVERRGPAANVKIGACVSEALERTLRALAPDADVVAWHARERRPSDEVRAGRPTHGCRVRYVLAATEHKGARRLVAAQTDALVLQVNDLRGELQAGKHASARTVDVLRGWLITTEAVLHQLTVALRG